MKHGRALAFGAASAALTALMAQFRATCPELLNQWPALVTAAVMAGVGYSMKPPTEPWNGIDRRGEDRRGPEVKP